MFVCLFVCLFVVCLFVCCLFVVYLFVACRRKLIGEINEMGDVVNGWEAKASALEKIKSRLTNELEDMHVQMEKVRDVISV